MNFSSILKADNIQESASQTIFDFSYLGKSYTITTSLPGKFNIQNILAALGVALEIGVPIEKAITSVEKFTGVEGRMQKITQNNISAYVDFAHTPDALEKTL
ncbi:TPA: hypothetical protein DEP21_03940 [Patescibacteria group bacterium]|nr:hypothetical protein [Candidatus Gracilibacteria bacterium]